MPYKDPKDAIAWRKSHYQQLLRNNRRYVSKHRELVNQRAREWARKHPEYIKAKDRKRYELIKKDPALYKAYIEKANKRSKTYRQKHPDRTREATRRWAKTHKEHIKEYGRKYKKANWDKVYEKHKKWLKENAEYFNKYRAEYHKKQRAKIISNPKLYEQVKKMHREYVKTKRNSNIEYAIMLRLRARIYEAVNRQNVIKAKSTADLIGCSIKRFKKHIEKQFEDGMTWDNMGKWHLDHIKPCISFDLTKPSQQKACFNYKNFQPMWGKDNLSKGSLFDGQRFFKRKSS